MKYPLGLEAGEGNPIHFLCHQSEGTVLSGSADVGRAMKPALSQATTSFVGRESDLREV
jgi:hypothetical protein